MDDVEDDRASEQAERKHDQHLMYRMSEKLCATVHDLLTSPQLVTHELGTKEKRARSSPAIRDVRENGACGAASASARGRGLGRCEELGYRVADKHGSGKRIEVLACEDSPACIGDQ